MHYYNMNFLSTFLERGATPNLYSIQQYTYIYNIELSNNKTIIIVTLQYLCIFYYDCYST